MEYEYIILYTYIANNIMTGYEIASDLQSNNNISYNVIEIKNIK